MWIVVVETKGMASVGGDEGQHGTGEEEDDDSGEERCWWLEAKEMWFGGCQSFVATRRTKRGEARRVLIRGVMERPPVTAREPFCEQT